MSNKAKKAAAHILEDRHGAFFYKDVKLMANHLKTALDITAEKAKEKADAIQEDHKGANFYEDVEILTGFLSKE